MRLATFLGGPGSKYLHMPSGWIQDQKTEIFVSATTHIAGYYEKICSHHIVPHILPPWKKTRAQAWMMMILMLKHGETRSGVKHHVTLKPGRRTRKCDLLRAVVVVEIESTTTTPPWRGIPEIQLPSAFQRHVLYTGASSLRS